MSLILLWELQELDLAIGVLTDKFEGNPLHQDVDDAAERMARIEEELERVGQLLQEQRKRLRRGELDLEAISAENEELHQRLYSGEVKNIKELEQMEIKLGSVKQKQLALEEELLSLMETIEEQEELAVKLTRQKKEAAAELHDWQRRLEEELALLGGELAELQEQRDRLTEQIEPDRLRLYDELMQRHRGRGIARVINDICQGCSVFISSAQRGFLYDPQALVYCENCGRLLVRFTEEEAGSKKADSQQS